MTLFSRFEQRPYFYTGVAVSLYILINNTINATSAWMEATRDGVAEFALWEPFCWEYSSAIATLILLVPMYLAWKRMPLRFEHWRRQLVMHLLLATLVSVLHVVLMVAIREGVYALAGGNYEFGPWGREFFYEYRKDVWGYLTFFVMYQGGSFIYRRLRGEADFVGQTPEKPSADSDIPEHFLVKKLDREFLVKVRDIEWMEAAGNYVNLHSGGRIYPLRGTLSTLSERMAAGGFSRVHRSAAVNHSAIAHISYLPSGDGEITLQSGQVVSLSRRYKESLKQRFS
ncbi:LytTR family transcriptional regulator [Aestuariibacter halophilus]|uniref:LytTR family transcriptional regulator n=1 Tax=Fluctibacter halophilus TaxID=226011 RepID=A0ABS8GBH6_9ALTE|nr:LytTR family DNA-binding domain-containing protein [Aestuariibacter halophilus]MCC2617947.1 LytTR family transcriptional regulator [Aestuariibacter halophilus]